MSTLEILINILQYLGIVLTGGLGTLALLAEYKDKDTRLPTKWGRRALVGVIISAVLLLGVQTAGLIQKLNERAEAVRSVQLQLQRHDEVLSEIAKEARRISPADFQIRLLSTAGTATPVDNWKPESVHVSGSVGDAFMIFDLTPAGIGEGGTRLRGYRIYYAASTLSLGNMEKYKYVDDLKGVSMKFDLPLAKLRPFEGRWEHYVDVYVKGRHFKGVMNEKGSVAVSLNEIN
jgi:hypothetical protein